MICFKEKNSSLNNLKVSLIIIKERDLFWCVDIYKNSTDEYETWKPTTPRLIGERLKSMKICHNIYELSLYSNTNKNSLNLMNSKCGMLHTRYYYYYYYYYYHYHYYQDRKEKKRTRTRTRTRNREERKTNKRLLKWHSDSIKALERKSRSY